jgi:hypothetical protein
MSDQESIFSIVDLLQAYPDYISFVQPAFYPSGAQPKEIALELKKVGPEAWPIDASVSNLKIYIVHSREDSLLSSAYNAQGISLLKEKGLDLIVDLDSFTVRRR